MIKMDSDDFYTLKMALVVELFPEEFDALFDSGSDLKDRAKGINPMTNEYAEKISIKRELYGLTPLAGNGVSTDFKSMELIARILKKVIVVVGE